ncbi:MAG: CoA-binding protein [Deltaproteobacteria bacterium]|nr:CoA-binding protein [Deltaproteobacteria bacterium]
MDLIKATSQAIGKILNAGSMAIVGASNDPRKFGYMTLETLIQGGFKGRIYPVNPKGGQVLGLSVYKSVNEIPESIDVALIVVPVQFIPDILPQVAAKGAAGVIICSGGFREAGRPDLEEEIVQTARQLGLRLLGPNISGIAYLPNKMSAQFFPVLTRQGPLAVISQSGTITNGLCEWASDEGLGVSAGINLGNQADLCESDYLDFFAEEENTKAIVVYLDGVKDGRRFLETLRRTTSRKPVVIIKGGRTVAGQRSTASHTASLASNYKVFAAACRQCGAYVAGDVETAYDAVKALACMRPPKGNRILSISTSGGANTLAMDEVDEWGLEAPLLPQALVEKLKGLKLSPLADFSNPVDLVSLKTDDFKPVALAAEKEDLFDTLLINFGDPVIGDLELVRFLDANLRASLAVSYFAGGDQEKRGRIEIQAAGYPVYPAPERAIRGISAKVWVERYWQTRKADRPGPGPQERG